MKEDYTGSTENYLMNLLDFYLNDNDYHYYKYKGERICGSG